MSQPLWPPIDDYRAPQRQVKIPSNPKVPPPFPVQLEEGGPLQLLGTNTSTTLNGTLDGPPFALPPPEGYVPGEGPYFPPLYPYPANATAGETPFPIPAYPPAAGQGEYNPGDAPAPFPQLLNGTLPPYFASLPPGAQILPPPDNTTDTYDEDDPSIYYPPPYSFFYPRDNSTEVPPGPLVPGIILPPPPDFFAPLEEVKKKPARTRKPTTTTEPPQIHPTTTPIPPTSVLDDTPTKQVTYLPTELNNELNPTTTPQPVVTILPVRQKTHQTIQTTPPRFVQRKKPVSVTILKPVKTTQPPEARPFAVYGPPAVNTTQIPLKAYYSTSNEIETNSVTENPKRLIYKVSSTVSPAEYYYYEEVTTKAPMKPSLPDPYINAQPTQAPKIAEPQIFYVTSRPRNTPRPKLRFLEQTSKPDTFSIHIARLRQQLQSFIAPKQRPQPVKPVYQYSFQAANYPQVHQQFRTPKVQEDGFKPVPKYSVQIQPAIEIVPSPPPQYYKGSTERPVASKYYSTKRPEYDYEDQGGVKQYVAPVRQYLPQKEPYVVTPQPQYYEATPNPIYHNYYTKPDEKYFDDITKKYFTIFGKKIPSATTPLPPPSTSAPNEQVYIQTPSRQRPISLEGDTLVNYLQPRPEINPDAEYIQQEYAKTAVRPQIVPKPQNQRLPIAGDPKSGSYISYQLPGDDGAHFYFLTPQLVQRTDQGSGFYFSQARKKRDER